MGCDRACIRQVCLGLAGWEGVERERRAFPALVQVMSRAPDLNGD